MRTSSDLFDPSVYAILPPVSVFRPHVRTDAQGLELYRVTDADLDTIAANIAAKMPGFIPRQTIGHIHNDADVREVDQPILVGFWIDPTVAYDEQVGCRCLQMKPVVRREFLDTIRNYPYRSAEYKPQSKCISGVARLLRDPALDLGITPYRADEPVYLYSMSGGISVVESQQATPANDAMTPEEERLAERQYQYLCRKYRWFGDMAKKYEAAATASPGNASLPRIADVLEAGMKCQSAESIELYQALQAERAEREKLVNQLAQTEVTRILDQLEKVELYQFDRAAETARMLAMAPEVRTAYVQEMRKYRPRILGAEPIQVYSGSVEGRPDTIPFELAERAAQLAAQEGISYEAARDRLKVQR